MRTSLVTLAGKLLDLFSLDPGTTCLYHLLPAQGLSGYTSPRGECSAFLLAYTPYRPRSLSGYTS
jgi:hypothetical protein